MQLFSRLALVGLLVSLGMTTVPQTASASTSTSSIVERPVVTRVGPTTGRTVGGQRVTISGRNFRGVRQVDFGGARAHALHVVSSTVVQVMIPPHAAGLVNVTVLTRLGWSRAVAADHFSYVAPPSILRVTPSEGVVAGGTRVTIEGSNLAGASVVLFGRYRASAVRVVSTSRVQATAPRAAAGSVDVRVATPYGLSAAIRADRFLYQPPPSVTGVSPAVLIPGYAESVVIHGSGFATPTTVTLDGVPAAGVVVQSVSQIEASITPSRPGTATLTLSTAWGRTSVPVPVVEPAPTTVSATTDYVGQVDLAWGAAQPMAVGKAAVRRLMGSAPPLSVDQGDPVLNTATLDATDRNVTPGDTYSYSVFLGDGAGHWSAPATLTVMVPRASSVIVGAASVVDRRQGGFTAPSCAERGWCMSVDPAGAAHIFDGTSWSGAVYTGVSDTYRGVSCSSRVFCLDIAYTAAVYDNGVWRAVPTPERASSYDVSCPVDGWCLAMDRSGRVFTFSDGSWSQGTSVFQATGGASRISCASTTFCLAGSGSGLVSVFDGTAWGTPTPIPGTSALSEISCPSSGFCAATTIDQAGDAALRTWSNGTWSAASALDDRSAAELTCTAPAFCVVGLSGGRAQTYDNGVSGQVLAIDAHVGQSAPVVSCSDPSFCVAVGDTGNSETFDGSVWSASTPYDPSREGLNDLACPTANFCMAADFAGAAITSQNGMWSAPVTVMPYGSLAGISCTSATFCAAVGYADGYPSVATYDGTSWSAPTAIADQQVYSFDAVSCATPTFCAALGYGVRSSTSYAFAVTWDGHSWSAARTLPLSGTPYSISCPSPTFCATGTDVGSGLGLIWNGTSWRTVAMDAYAVACLSPNACVAAGHSQWSQVWDGTTWLAASRAPTTIQHIACPSSARCVATGSGYGVVDYDGTSWSAETSLPGLLDVASVSCPSDGSCVLAGRYTEATAEG